MSPSATDAAAAVEKADALLEYPERIGIRDYLQPDGVSVRAPASMSVELTDAARSDSDLRVTSPDGKVSDVLQ